MANIENGKAVSTIVAIAVAFASLVVAIEPARSATGLFRAKRTWWFNMYFSTTLGGSFPTLMAPSAQAHVGSTPGNPSFTAPRSFIKNTTYTYICPAKYPCPPGILNATETYSYWNAKGSFRPSNPYAPTTTSTVRVRTVFDGWPGPAVNPPTAMYTIATPTEGGCYVNGSTVFNPDQCLGTTQFSGRYAQSRGGSIMIWPGAKRFGGTMRFFEGPNALYSRLTTIDFPYYHSVVSPPAPISQQLGTGVEFEVGEVTRGGGHYRIQQGRVGYHYRLESPYGSMRLIFGATPSGGSCTQRPPPYPPNGSGLCAYYRKTAHHLATGVPYTTGVVQVWQPNGYSSTIVTTNGYDNRTSLGLNGTISMVHPRLVHTYTVSGSSIPAAPIKMTWSAARMTKIGFHFAPESAGLAGLAAGFVTLALLVRLRR